MHIRFASLQMYTLQIHLTIKSGEESKKDKFLFHWANKMTIELS